MAQSLRELGRNISGSMVGFNKFELYLIRLSINSRIFKKTAYTYLERIMYNFLDNIPKEKLFKKLSCMKKYNSIDTEISRIDTYSTDMNTRYGYPNSFFDELCEMEFEGHKFLASKHYRELLYLAYG